MTTQMPPEQAAIDRKIVDEIFDTIPEEWTSVQMIVEPRTEIDGGGETITILNPDIAGADMPPSDTIRANVAALAAFLAKEGRKWERLTYSAFQDDSGAWRLKITTPLPD